MIKGRKKKYYVLEDRIKVEGKYITKNIRYLGTAEKIFKDLQDLDQLKKRSKKS